MKILYLTTKFPDPPDSGGKIVTRNVISELTRLGHEIDLSTLSGSENVRKLGRRLKGVKIQNIPDVVSGGEIKFPDLVRSYFRSRPYVIEKYVSKKAEIHLLRLYRENDYDIIIFDHLHTAYYGTLARDITDSLLVLLEHNLELELWQTLAENEKNIFRRLFFRNQAEKVKSYEGTTAGKFDLCICLSREDETKLNSLSPVARVSYVKPGIYLEDYEPRPLDEPGKVCIVGRMDWLPNARGALWFSRQIWPKILQKYPEAELDIVGANPPKRLQTLDKRGRITVTGRVPYVQPYIERARVFVVPIKSGSGVRIKILQAWSLETPVVSTRKGCQGLSITSDEDCLIADSEKGFSEAVLALLTDESKRARVAGNAKNLVKEKYSAQSMGAKCETILLDQLGEKLNAQ